MCYANFKVGFLDNYLITVHFRDDMMILSFTDASKRYARKCYLVYLPGAPHQEKLVAALGLEDAMRP
jgi:hypothetical protein